jgi:hypothetical protein
MSGKKEPRITLFAVGVDVPLPSHTVDVKAMGPAPFGLLCSASGTVLPPSGLLFDGLYFKIGRIGQTWTCPQVVAFPDKTLSRADLYGSGPTNVTASWNMDQQFTADCGPAGSEPTNHLYVVSRSFAFNPSNPMNPYQEKLECNNAGTPFKGRSRTECGRSAARSTSAASVPDRAPATATPLPSAGPSDTDGDWLLYRDLSVSSHFYGTRLMRHGSPLRAKTIAVAAANVDYSFSPPSSPSFPAVRRHVRRAAGDLKFEPFRPSPWRFPDAPANGIAVWQHAVGLQEHAVASECRTRPDFIHLESEQDILVQINYLSFVQNTYRGSFDLWVKIID